MERDGWIKGWQARPPQPLKTDDVLIVALSCWSDWPPVSTCNGAVPGYVSTVDDRRLLLQVTRFPACRPIAQTYVPVEGDATTDVHNFRHSQTEKRIHARMGERPTARTAA